MEQPNMFPVTTNEELFRILFPSIKEAADASDTNTVTGLLTDFCYALLLYKPVPGGEADQTARQEDELRTFLREAHQIHCFRFHGHNMGLISFSTWDWDRVQAQTAKIEGSISQYLRAALEKTGIELNMSIGRPFMGLLNLREAYSELINSTMTFSLRPKNLVVSEYDIVSDPALIVDPYPRSEIELQLADAIIKLEIRKAEELMENIIQHEMSTLHLKLSFLPRMAIRIEWMLTVLHVPRNSGDASSAEIYSYPQRIKYAESLQDGVALIHACFQKLDDYYNAFRFNVGKDISQITDYIHAQASNPNLNATMICDCFRISPSYLSHMFKRRTGIKLVDYIHKARISQAKQLLETTTATIAEISRQVSYTSSASFSTTFKRYEAITPREYRDRFLWQHRTIAP